MQSYFCQLFNYDLWAMRCLFEIFDQKPAANPRIHELLSHIISVQRIWIDRCQYKPDTAQRFEHKTPAILRDEMQLNHDAWIAYMQSLQPADFDKQISYKNFQGDFFSNRLSEIITQVINHGTHHRGTVIALMKEEGYPPPNLDYISFTRV